MEADVPRLCLCFAAKINERRSCQRRPDILKHVLGVIAGAGHAIRNAERPRPQAAKISALAVKFALLVDTDEAALRAVTSLTHCGIVTAAFSRGGEATTA